MHDKVFNDPRSVIRNYVIEVMQYLGAEPGGSWQFCQVSQKIQWSRMRSLHRIPYHM